MTTSILRLISTSRLRGGGGSYECDDDPDEHFVDPHYSDSGTGGSGTEKE